MGLVADLEKDVAEIFATAWKSRDGLKVPDAEDVGLGNDAVKITAAVLYADLAESTSLVDGHPHHFSAEVYKSYLRCASKIIRAQSGVITAFDGDRIMALFIGEDKNTLAVRAALAINYAVIKIINPALVKQYPRDIYRVKHAVGVDTAELFAARTGIRGSNDLVWVGRAANYAAKLCSLRSGNKASFITKAVYDNMRDGVKFSSDRKQNMWEQFTWPGKNIIVYNSTWHWGL